MYLQVVLLSGFTLIKPNIPPWYIGESTSLQDGLVLTMQCSRQPDQLPESPLLSFVVEMLRCDQPTRITGGPYGISDICMPRSNVPSWQVGTSDALRCAGGYWALPLQWLTTSIVNNEFLDGERPCVPSYMLQIAVAATVDTSCVCSGSEMT